MNAINILANIYKQNKNFDIVTKDYNIKKEDNQITFFLKTINEKTNLKFKENIIIWIDYKQVVKDYIEDHYESILNTIKGFENE